MSRTFRRKSVKNSEYESWLQSQSPNKENYGKAIYHSDAFESLENMDPYVKTVKKKIQRSHDKKLKAQALVDSEVSFDTSETTSKKLSNKKYYWD